MSETRISAELRRRVTERAQGCCEYCRSQASHGMDSFSVEHIIPEAQGGLTDLDNLALSCQGCNGHKSAKTQGRDLQTGELVALFHPRRQRWRDHFGWNDSFTEVIGTTPIGRATIEELHLNREGLVNLRRVLRAFGVHPPPLPE